MVQLLERIAKTRARVAHRFGKFFESGEAVTHFFYGIAVITETHWEVTIYSGTALCLGCAALLVAIVGKSGE